MGASRVSIIKDGNTRQKAMQHLLQNLAALEKMLSEEMFETDVQCIGAEQELHFAGKDWRLANVAMQVLEELKDDRNFTTEVAQFNMEISLDPMVFEGECLRRLEQDLYVQLKRVEMAAQRFDAHTVMVGVLPTVHREDIDWKNLTLMDWCFPQSPFRQW